MRTIGVVTVARSDYGIYRPLLRKIRADSSLKLHLIVSGMHLSPEFGMTVTEIESDGFAIADRVEMLFSSDSPEGIAKSMGAGVMGFAQSYARKLPDILFVLGDRFEMHAAAVAALPFKLPVAHIQGGELTQGAIDDALRHSMTKLSHLHFASTREYAQRIIQMGEENWRVCCCGAPGLDNLGEIRLLSRGELESKFGLRLDGQVLIVTFHPVTLEYEDTERQTLQLLAAIKASGLPAIFTQPNADTHGRIIMRLIKEHLQTNSTAQYVENFGTQGYFSLMSMGTAMVGNSSSGIIEAASFKLPVVNIGTRQSGRVRASNVIDTGCSSKEILAAIRKAISPAFRKSLTNLKNPYGTGRAAEKILKRLKAVSINQRLLQKQFQDLAEH